MSGTTPPAPFRGAPPPKTDASDDEDDDEEDGAAGGGDQAGPGMNVIDLIPRNDIADQITSGLIEELNDSKWKVRGEALEKVCASFIIWILNVFKTKFMYFYHVRFSHHYTKTLLCFIYMIFVVNNLNV